MRKNLFGMAALFGLLAGGPALAADACLMSARISSWSMSDARNLSVEDNSGATYTVHLAPGCESLSNANTSVGFESQSTISCIGQGDKLAFNDPTRGRASCVITGVEKASSEPANGGG